MTVIEPLFNELTVARQRFVNNLSSAFRENARKGLVAETRSQTDGRMDVSST